MVATPKMIQSMPNALPGGAKAIGGVGHQKGSPELAHFLKDGKSLPEGLDFKALLETMSVEDANKLIKNINSQSKKAKVLNEQMHESLESATKKNPKLKEQADLSDILKENKNSQKINNNTQKAAVAGSALLATKAQPQTTSAEVFTTQAQGLPVAQMNKSLATPAMNQQVALKKLQDTNSVVQLNQLKQNNPTVTTLGKQAQGQYNHMANINNSQVIGVKPRPVKSPIAQTKVSETTAIGGVSKAATTKSESASSSSLQEVLSSEGPSPETIVQTKFDSSQGLQNNNSQMPKTFDVNQLSQVDTSDREAIINKVQNYIVQAKAGNETSVQMNFTDPEIGQVDLMVSKAQGDQLNIVINTADVSGSKFFAQNKAELMQSLAQAGIQINDFKLENSSNKSFDFNRNDSEEFAHNKEQKEHTEDQRRHKDSERRESIWDMFNDQEA